MVPFCQKAAQGRALWVRAKVILSSALPPQCPAADAWGKINAAPCLCILPASGNPELGSFPSQKFYLDSFLFHEFFSLLFEPISTFGMKSILWHWALQCITCLVKKYFCCFWSLLWAWLWNCRMRDHRVAEQELFGACNWEMLHCRNLRRTHGHKRRSAYLLFLTLVLAELPTEEIIALKNNAPPKWLKSLERLMQWTAAWLWITHSNKYYFWKNFVLFFPWKLKSPL